MKRLRNVSIVLVTAALLASFAPPASASCISVGNPDNCDFGGRGEGGGGGGGGATNPPKISCVDRSQAEGTYQTGNAAFLTPFKITFKLSHAASGQVTVDYATSPGSALEGGKGDYDGKTGTVKFAPGVVSKKITVNVHADTFGEEDENFFINLSGAHGGRLPEKSGCEVTIVNDDSQNQF